MPQTDEIDFRAFFHAVPGLYMILSPDLFILTATEAYLNATMTQLPAIRGRHLFDVFPDNPDDPDATGESNLYASLQTVLREKTTHTMAVQKYDVRRPDGVFEERYWSCLNTPVFDDKGEVTFIIHRAEDVTAYIHLQHAQAKYQELNEGLQQKMGWMQSEIYNRAQEIQDMNSRLMLEAEQRKQAELQLELKSAQLEKANKELETFSFSVSHDLRAPLRVIDGFAKIMVSDYHEAIDAEGRRLLNIIIDNVQRMGRLIDDLLNLSRTVRVSVNMRPVDMNNLVELILNEQLDGNRPKYEIRQDDLLPAFCDRNLIYQVWTNLISNAIKYAGQREHPVIEISSYRSDTDGTVYSVKDNGVGFDMKYAGKLFGVFQRLHSADEFEGTGVGLALVQQIVTRHEGRVWADAERDKGATFSFSLPDKELKHSPGNN